MKPRFDGVRRATVVAVILIGSSLLTILMWWEHFELALAIVIPSLVVLALLSFCVYEAIRCEVKGEENEGYIRCALILLGVIAVTIMLLFLERPRS